MCGVFPGGSVTKTPNVGSLGSIPSEGMRSRMLYPVRVHMPQLKDPTSHVLQVRPDTAK